MSDDNLRKKGVIYYATGEEYLEDAKDSARSLKEHNNLHVTVFTDIDSVESKFFDNIENINPGEYPFYDRINYFKKSPYQKTLHLDTDTYIAGDITPIFEMLERFDVVAAINETRNTVAEHTKFETLDLDIPNSFPEYQCGVIGFNKEPEVMQLLEDWQTRYEKYRDRNVLDQPFFRETVYRNENIQLGTLPSEYNLLVNFPGYLEKSVEILHFGGDRKPKPEKILQILDSNVGEPRVFYTGITDRIETKPDNDNLHILVRSIYRNGFYKTIKKLIYKLKTSL